MPVFRPSSLVLIFSLEHIFGIVDAESSVFRLPSPQRYSDILSKASPQLSSYRSSEGGDSVCLMPCCLPLPCDCDYHVINVSKCLSVCSRRMELWLLGRCCWSVSVSCPGFLVAADVCRQQWWSSCRSLTYLYKKLGTELHWKFLERKV